MRSPAPTVTTKPSGSADGSAAARRSIAARIRADAEAQPRRPERPPSRFAACAPRPVRSVSSSGRFGASRRPSPMRCDEVAIVIEDEPTDEELEENDLDPRRRPLRAVRGRAADRIRRRLGRPHRTGSRSSDCRSRRTSRIPTSSRTRSASRSSTSSPTTSASTTSGSRSSGRTEQPARSAASDDVRDAGEGREHAERDREQHRDRHPSKPGRRGGRGQIQAERPAAGPGASGATS